MPEQRATNGANLGFENELWRAADALRSNMDAAEYKHVVLDLIPLVPKLCLGTHNCGNSVSEFSTYTHGTEAELL